jgi:hypothetical protein
MKKVNVEFLELMKDAAVQEPMHHMIELLRDDSHPKESPYRELSAWYRKLDPNDREMVEWVVGEAAFLSALGSFGLLMEDPAENPEDSPCYRVVRKNGNVGELDLHEEDPEDLLEAFEGLFEEDEA